LCGRESGVEHNERVLQSFDCEVSPVKGPAIAVERSNGNEGNDARLQDDLHV
jgi:hypothetical protein